MTQISESKLIDRAITAVNPVQLVDEGVAGEVAAAIQTIDNNIYTGVSIDVACSMGFCAEHSAIASMVAAGETKITMVVAILENGDIIPPCGRCRELMTQIDRYNLENTTVILSAKRSLKLRELLPFPSQDYFDGKKI